MHGLSSLALLLFINTVHLTVFQFGLKHHLMSNLRHTLHGIYKATAEAVLPHRTQSAITDKGVCSINPEAGWVQLASG